jgi:hypothetical protein
MQFFWSEHSVYFSALTARRFTGNFGAHASKILQLWERALRLRSRIVKGNRAKLAASRCLTRGEMESVADAIWDSSCAFSWRATDVLLLDNLRIAHSKFPHKGGRSLYAAIADMVNVYNYATAEKERRVQ